MSPEAVLPVVQAVLQTATVVGGGVWAVFLYTRQRRDEKDKEAKARMLEAQRPFLQKQLEVYFETCRVVGELVTRDITSDAWRQANTRFWALYWSEMPMVEHLKVQQALGEFGGALQFYKEDPGPASQESLKVHGCELSCAIRQCIESAWKTDQQSVELKEVPEGVSAPA